MLYVFYFTLIFKSIFIFEIFIYMFHFNKENHIYFLHICTTEEQFFFYLFIAHIYYRKTTYIMLEK